MLSEKNQLKKSDRATSFKKTVNSSDGRRCREETTLQIRKQKRDQQLKKKREAPRTLDDNDNGSPPVTSSSNKQYTEDEIPELAAILMGIIASPDGVLEPTRHLRRLLTRERNPPVREVLSTGVLPYVIENLTKDVQNVWLVFESAWVLTNIAATEHAKDVACAGAIRPLVFLLYNEIPNVREQAVWCLGNIAGESVDLRDQVLHHGAMPPLIRNIEEPHSISLLENCLWCISHLCRGKPSPERAFTDPVIYPMVSLMHKLVNLEGSEEALNDLLWALSYLSDGDETRIEHVMGSGVTSNLIALLKENRSKINKSPLVRVLGNFICGSENQTQSVLDAGLLDCVGLLLESSSSNVRKDTCWTLSNIAAGTPKQAGKLVNNQEIMELVIRCAKSDTWIVRKEALWTLANFCYSGQAETQNPHVVSLLKVGGLEPLVMVLAVVNVDVTLLEKVLGAIGNILRAGSVTDTGYVYMVEELNGISYIENLQEHPCQRIYDIVILIIEEFFGVEEEDENLAPTLSESGRFGFGITSPKQLFPDSSRGIATSQQTYDFSGLFRS